ncbi:unnamed protein product, partial [Ectocarpus sp. 8 AP-2014]
GRVAWEPHLCCMYGDNTSHADLSHQLILPLPKGRHGFMRSNKQETPYVLRRWFCYIVTGYKRATTKVSLSLDWISAVDLTGDVYQKEGKLCWDCFWFRPAPPGFQCKGGYTYHVTPGVWSRKFVSSRHHLLGALGNMYSTYEVFTSMYSRSVECS